jgi:hypothetical protein
MKRRRRNMAKRAEGRRRNRALKMENYRGEE